MEQSFISCSYDGKDCYACGWNFVMCSCEEDFEDDYASYKKECEQ